MCHGLFRAIHVFPYHKSCKSTLKCLLWGAIIIASLLRIRPYNKYWYRTKSVSIAIKENIWSAGVVVVICQCGEKVPFGSLSFSVPGTQHRLTLIFLAFLFLNPKTQLCMRRSIMMKNKSELNEKNITKAALWELSSFVTGFPNQKEDFLCFSPPQFLDYLFPFDIKSIALWFPLTTLWVQTVHTLLVKIVHTCCVSNYRHSFSEKEVRWAFRTAMN